MTRHYRLLPLMVAAILGMGAAAGARCAGRTGGAAMSHVVLRRKDAEQVLSSVALATKELEATKRTQRYAQVGVWATLELLKTSVAILSAALNEPVDGDKGAEHRQVMRVVREAVAALGLEQTDESIGMFCREFTTNDSAAFERAIRALVALAEQKEQQP